MVPIDLGGDAPEYLSNMVAMGTSMLAKLKGGLTESLSGESSVFSFSSAPAAPVVESDASSGSFTASPGSASEPAFTRTPSESTPATPLPSTPAPIADYREDYRRGPAADFPVVVAYLTLAMASAMVVISLLFFHHLQEQAARP